MDELEMKKPHLLCLAIVLILFVLVSGCVNQEYFIRARHQSNVPINAINITEEQMELYPHLLEAIITNSTVKTPKAEFDELHTLLWNINGTVIHYLDNYYEITFIFAD